MTALKGANALATGGSRGLGKAPAEDLYTRGADKVYATARRPRGMTHPDAVPVALEITALSPWRPPPRKAILINNVGAAASTRTRCRPGWP